MKTQKLMVLFASAALGLGLAGCVGNTDASAPTYMVPTISQMDKEKQVLMAECKEKAAKDYAAKVKAEKEAQTKAEAEAAAQAEAGVQAGGQAPSGGNYQSQARPGGTYQGRSKYQAPRRSGGNYQGPRRSGGAAPKPKGNSGSKGGWSNGSTNTKDGKYWYVKDGVDEVHVCGDTEGNSWPC